MSNVKSSLKFCENRQNSNSLLWSIVILLTIFTGFSDCKSDESEGPVIKSFFGNILNAANNISHTIIGKVEDTVENIEEWKISRVKTSNKDVKFLLFDHQSNSARPINVKTYRITDESKPVIVVIHGWTDNGTLPWIIELESAYSLSQKNSIFISVDWEKYAARWYPLAAASTRIVGKISAQMLWEILGQNVNLLRNVHVIGHSMGAHVAAFMGQNIQELAPSKKIARITGLDPANPLFIAGKDDSRLDKTDAEFVDCLHTDIGFRGQGRTCGTVDIYFNCQYSFQPSCVKSDNTSFNDASSCSHQKVHSYYIKTVTEPHLYKAERCRVKNLFGVTTDNNPHLVAVDSDKSEIYTLFAGEFVNQKASGTFCVSTLAKRNVEECYYLSP